MANTNPVKQIILKNVRLSFPAIFEPTSFEGQEEKYDATFLIPKNDPQVKMLADAIKEIAAEKWGAGGFVPKGDKTCVRDGNEKEYDGYPDHYYVKASSRKDKRPTVINRDKTPLRKEDGVIYAGCYVNAAIGLWAQDNQFGKRINAFLHAVQFAAPGEPFGSSFDANSAFEDLTDGETHPAHSDGQKDDDLPF